VQQYAAAVIGRITGAVRPSAHLSVRAPRTGPQHEKKNAQEAKLLRTFHVTEVNE